MTKIYLNSSCSEMYKYWALSGKKIPMEDAIKITVQLIEHGLKGITKEN